ncbi:MAG: UDP-N-acetylmuramate dehydrogenase [Lentisphaeria bacterium]|nr:UDP-N-acetylmuramate dehydrogenase [Lentisphaeria bacterium]
MHENINLSEYSSLQLGGPAAYFFDCDSVESIIEALNFAEAKGLAAHVLGAGSNTLFADAGYNGVILHICLEGIHQSANHIHAAAGENWDSFVAYTVDQGLAGIECLSGIPGYVGASPIQNIGAYGQEVSETIVSVKALKIENRELLTFNNADCDFSYRQSRFKSADKGAYIILEVTYELQQNSEPQICYPELAKQINSIENYVDKSPQEKLQLVREHVLEIRKHKSMVLDPGDPNSISAGSFFMNPIISQSEFEHLKQAFPEMPNYPNGDQIKIPAAWLVEQSGFHKGYTYKNAGVSEKHCLALINRNGSTADLIELAEQIQNDVQKKFEIALQREPVYIE